MTPVRTSTTDLPELVDVLARRERVGLSIYDEWWEGEYRTVTGPTPEHGRLLDDLALLLVPLARDQKLHTAAPLNIGLDRWDCRVPDRGIYRPDTPRSSAAFLTTALMVIEVLSPGEPAGEKLDFYQAHEVSEYLEIDLPKGTVRLLRFVENGWLPVTESDVVALRVESARVVADHAVVDVREYLPYIA